MDILKKSRYDFTEIINKINKATYYYRKKHPEGQRVYNGGRKIPGYSLTLNTIQLANR